jgi:hypothetical protein
MDWECIVIYQSTRSQSSRDSEETRCRGGRDVPPLLTSAILVPDRTSPLQLPGQPRQSHQLALPPRMLWIRRTSSHLIRLRSLASHSFMTSSAPPKRDLIAIIGTTGVGKSQLAIELALALPRLQLSVENAPTKAEVINADSMQVYEGLDIITNKVTVEEMKGVPHHLLGFVEREREYMVGDFQRDAIKKVSSSSIVAG